MKTHDPIEEIIKQRMDGLQRSTDVPTWNAVASTLKRRKREKAMIWIWSSAGLLTLLALLIFTNKNTEETTVTQEDTPAVEEVISEQPQQEEVLPVIASQNEENSSEDAGESTGASEAGEIVNTDQGVIEDFTKNAEVKPTYYYYDSKTGKQISTTDKKVIDSLTQLGQKQRVADSTN